MASQRDELNAYTFAKRRTLAAFLQPSASGSEEGAPKPLRAVVPSLVAGAVALAVFGAWGMFQPTAPSDWDNPGTRVIVGKQSTTRYVVLKTGKTARLHPVLNLASARLLMKNADYQVIQVSDKILDSGDLPRGPILGIPYAPDRLPSADEAGQAKRWAVCEQPGGKGETVQQATFVLARRDAAKTDGSGRLKGGDVLYVKTRTGERYLVDAHGTSYAVTGTESGTLAKALVGTRKPQLVTKQWLATLHQGDAIKFPEMPSDVGTPARVPGQLSAAENRVGMVLRTATGDGTKYYVVMPGKVQPVSEFTARLIIFSPETGSLNMNGHARPVDLQDFTADPEPFAGQAAKWPQRQARQVNSAVSGSAHDTVCSVLRDVGDVGKEAGSTTTLSMWASTDYPAEMTADGTGTYVTPGTGLLYTQIQGTQTGAGSLFLVTDTGLRYAVQANGDSDSRKSDIGADGEKTSDGTPEPSEAQVKLGYQNVRPAKVPLVWSEFLAKGPRLDTNGARQPQGS